MKDTLIKIIFMLYFSMIYNIISGNAQSDYIKNRWSIQLGHCKYDDFGKGLFNKYLFGMSDYRLGVNYGLTNTIEVGAYGGIAQVANFAFGDTIQNVSVNYSPSTSFGVQAQYHLLPYIVKSEDFRFDVYIKGSIGLRKTKNRISEANNGVFPEYGAGLGASFYVLKNVGLYGEYTFGKFNTVRHSLQRSALRYGIVIKF